MNGLYLKLCSSLAVTVCAVTSLAQAQPLPHPQKLKQGEKAAIISLLKEFSAIHPLMRQLQLEKDPLSNGVKLSPSQYAGQIGPGAAAFGAYFQGDQGWEIRQFVLQPYREDLLHLAGREPLLDSDQKAWEHAEAQFSKEIRLGEGLERGRAIWLSYEGREKVAVRLDFKPKPKDYPVGAGSSALTVQFRASDGALMEVFNAVPLAYTAGPINITKDKAAAVAGNSMLPKTDKLSARLAYLLPPYAFSPGLIDRRTGKEIAPALKLMWEVTGPAASAAVDPETGTVAWVYSEHKFPTHLAAHEPTDGGFPILAKESGGIPWPHQDLVIQVAGVLGVFLAVGLVINWLMKKDSSTRT